MKIKVKLTKNGATNSTYIGCPTHIGSEKKIIVNNANKQEATTFFCEPHLEIKGAYYLKVDKYNQYLDQETITGEVFLNRPNIDIHKSTIWAWKLFGQNMGAVAYVDKDGLQKISEPNSENQQINPEKLYCNFGTEKILTVEWVKSE